jgi:hypothetical protein
LIGLQLNLDAKFPCPNNRQIPITKMSNDKSKQIRSLNIEICLELEDWNLGFIHDLGFVIWNILGGNSHAI